MRIATEEIFGPVASIFRFKTEEEAVDLANDTSYGLATNVFTQNITRAIRVSNALEAGMACVCFEYLLSSSAINLLKNIN